ncbi:glutamate--cysteine ligase [Streptomyces sp. SL13]|uniref:Putative glutamate--cysteine ligase 2 n=1 Tax=Streptantibioticus silvisoli TaxID=2705255 RepID=A0AA90H2X0_9ACTN|nr:glutamate--cysteine ligase [Streptantibioticus silvisoli]MDI5962163.1 glutamate--cysteine ligase [Streptantibioticus silvisoli]MDI5972429.1 glutamate--cysteine ligase [Streptantibioticus silvisoli]
MVTVGVEEEYLLLDAESGSPVSRWEEVRAAAVRQPALLNGEVERELLQAQVEVATPVCGSIDEVGDHLRRLRGALHLAAAETGCRIAACGAAPFLGPATVTDEPRYRTMLDDAARLVDEMMINGMHVHVAVPDRRAAIAALNRIRRWLPVLVALGSNSPYWDGSETGFASWRTVVFGRWPVSGPPPVFAGPEDYDHRTAALLRTGVIRDRGQIYWQARPSERYPTLEVRALDVQLLPEDAVTLAGLIRSLVATALREADDGTPFTPEPSELLAAANWHAARHGLNGELVDPVGGGLRPAAEVVTTLLEHLTPALKEAGDLDRVEGGVRRLLTDGSGEQRQRRALDGGGPGALLDLLGAGGGGLALPPGAERETIATG